jgi:hypothetical protein
MNQLFTVLSFAPGPFWLLLLFLPGDRRAMLAVDVFLVLLSVSFTALALPAIGELLPLLLRPEFDEMRRFLMSDRGFTGTWNHMILSDLWIGRWVAQDTMRATRPLLVRVVFIPLIMLFGPLGLFGYLAFRVISRRELALTRVEPAN